MKTNKPSGLQIYVVQGELQTYGPICFYLYGLAMDKMSLLGGKNKNSWVACVHN